MNLYDFFDICVFLFLVTCSLSCFLGWFISFLMFFFSIVVGWNVANYFYLGLMDMCGWSHTILMSWVAWIILFALTKIAIQIILVLLNFLMKKYKLTFLSYSLGLIVGFLLIPALLLGIVGGMIYFCGDSLPMVAHARSAKYLLQIASVEKQILLEDNPIDDKKVESVYQMLENFTQQIQDEQAKHPELATSEEKEKKGIPLFLDKVDALLQPLFINDKTQEK